MDKFANGEVYIDFKVNKIIKEVDDFIKNYQKKYGRRYSGPRDKIYLIHQEVPEGKSPMNVYVGKTRQELINRLSQHTAEVVKARSGDKEWTIKLVWLNRVLENGFSLKIRLLSNVPRSLVYRYESEWITYLSIRGFNVMNTDNKKYWDGENRRVHTTRFNDL